jgi:uncharacterized repeat protein (TIGR01451 family)
MKRTRPFRRFVVVLVAMGAVLVQAGVSHAAPPSADLKVTKGGTPNPAPVGTNIDYTITVKNLGPDDAAKPHLTDAVPSDTTFVSLNADPNWTCTAPAVGATGTIVCNRSADMPSSTTDTFDLKVKIVSTPSSCTIKNTASVSSTTADPDGSNDSATEFTKVTSCADVSVTKTDSPDPVTDGTTLTYTITVKNNDAATAATGLLLNDTIPLNTTFVSMPCPSGWTCSTPAVGGAGNVTATNPSLAAGASSVFTLKVRVGSTATGLLVTSCTITNTATVTTASFDPDTTSNTAKTTTAVADCADLSVTKTAFPDPVIAGTNLSYTITVLNKGPNASFTPLMTDTLPFDTTFVAITCAAGWTCTTPFVGGPGTVTATTTTLANGASATFTLVVKVNPSTPGNTLISNTATVSAGTVARPSPDPDSTNNNAKASVVAHRSADLLITKNGRPHPVKPGHVITYTITVQNAGPSDAKNVKIRDFVGHHVVFESVTAGCSHPASGDTGGVHCSLGPVHAGGSVVITLVVRVKNHASPGALVRNTAHVSSPTPDPDHLNNHATATATVHK